MGWETETAELYKYTTKRIALCYWKSNGQWQSGVVLSTLSAKDVLLLTNHHQTRKMIHRQSCMLAYIHFNDECGGRIEIEIKEVEKNKTVCFFGGYDWLDDPLTWITARVKNSAPLSAFSI